MDPWTLLLSPILFLQGKWVKLRTPKLPEAPGPRSGERGSGPGISLLVLGDSAAAGVGIEHQSLALSGRLANQLEPHGPLQWQLHARSGLNTPQALHLVQAIEHQSFDVVLVSLGVNDVLSPISEARWLEELTRLTETLRQRFSPNRILYTALPPLGAFPALPWPLRAHLGRRAVRFNRHLGHWVEQQPDLALLNLAEPGGDLLSHLAPDRFHPGELAHQRWAELACREITPLLAQPEQAQSR
ncbi:SGNH/GDSL hydrolase family protein [Ferrimonas balearica]|uniref:SGNH/GDSL hydrolase family protein n=1 Tax=Ferrimonas balearica TaxID=44012 RepID=UPI0021BDC52D|nr:SGNH/GDSL hydrolase family protein [Ferrimonas balearica]